MPYDITERPQADRLKAFEMYLSASTSGKSRSLRSIGAELGVSSMTISRWREVDKWDDKISKVLSAAATSAETTSNALKRRVRQGLLDGLSQLQHIAMNGAQDRDKIAAVKALADIAIRIEAITAAATAGQGEKGQTIEFSDELPERDSLVSGPAGGGGVLRPSETLSETNDVGSSDRIVDDGPGYSGPRVEDAGSLERAFEEIEAGDEAAVQNVAVRDESSWK